MPLTTNSLYHGLHATLSAGPSPSTSRGNTTPEKYLRLACARAAHSASVMQGRPTSRTGGEPHTHENCCDLLVGAELLHLLELAVGAGGQRARHHVLHLELRPVLLAFRFCCRLLRAPCLRVALELELARHRGARTRRAREQLDGAAAEHARRALLAPRLEPRARGTLNRDRRVRATELRRGLRAGRWHTFSPAAQVNMTGGGRTHQRMLRRHRDMR